MMTTSQTSLLTNAIDGSSPLSEGALSYFRERQRNKLFDKIVGVFLEKEKTQNLSRADLARRLKKRPEQVTRWLSSPSNWTIDTLSDLTLAICGGELDFQISLISEMPKRNCTQLDIISEKNFQRFSPQTSTSINSFKNVSVQINEE